MSRHAGHKARSGMSLHESALQCTSVSLTAMNTGRVDEAIRPSLDTAYDGPSPTVMGPQPHSTWEQTARAIGSMAS